MPTSEIYIIRPSGSEFYQITSDRLVANHGDWSPDGRKISFFDADNNLNILSLDTFEVTQVGQLRSDRNAVASADWNPQNNTVVVAASKSLILFDIENHTYDTILKRNGFIESVRWNLSGTSIAFVVRQGGEESGIYILDTVTNVLSFIFPYTQSISNLIWSPDEENLYLTLVDNSHQTLYSLNINDGELINLTIDNYGDYPELSPSGDWVVFVAYDASTTQLPQIYKAHLNGQEGLQRITTMSSCYVSNPRWFSFNNR